MKYGVREDEIRIIHDADFNNFKNDVIDDAMGLVSANWRDGRKKTFIFVYYAGHGIM